MDPTDSYVLIVDDHDAIRSALVDSLRSEGYWVEEAASAPEALERMSHSARLPCLILLDLRMPVMSGWEFLERKDRDPLFASIPVVVLTAEDARTTPEVPNTEAIVRKPVSLDDLLVQVERFCRPARSV